MKRAMTKFLTHIKNDDLASSMFALSLVEV